MVKKFLISFSVLLSAYVELAISAEQKKTDIDDFGRNKNVVCRNYALARQECALAAKYSMCMDIKDKNKVNGNPMWYADKDSCKEDGSRERWY